MYRARSAQVRTRSSGAFDKQMRKRFDKLVKKKLIRPRRSGHRETPFRLRWRGLARATCAMVPRASSAKGSCHPYIRRGNWETRTLMVAGNFNMANAGELTRHRHQPAASTRSSGPTPRRCWRRSDSTSTRNTPTSIDRSATRVSMVRRSPSSSASSSTSPPSCAASAEHWDGGYTIAGAVGNGDCFVHARSRMASARASTSTMMSSLASPRSASR